jgi:ferredoxin
MVKEVLFRRTAMAHIINDTCAACGACITECPVEAIKEGDPIYTIDADTCIDCAACVDACPTGAISAA